MVGRRPIGTQHFNVFLPLDALCGRLSEFFLLQRWIQNKEVEGSVYRFMPRRISPKYMTWNSHCWVSNGWEECGEQESQILLTSQPKLKLNLAGEQHRVSKRKNKLMIQGHYQWLKDQVIWWLCCDVIGGVSDHDTNAYKRIIRIIRIKRTKRVKRIKGVKKLIRTKRIKQMERCKRKKSIIRTKAMQRIKRVRRIRRIKRINE